MSTTATSDHHRFARIAAIGGFMAVVMSLSGASLTGLMYTGRTQEHYSIFNHFISELGNYRWSRAALVFNGGLILAGIALIFFINGSALLLRTRLRYLLMACGTVSGILCSLVGVFSESRLSIHLTVAPLFFVLIFISVMIYCVAVWMERDHHFLMRWYALAGLPAAVFLFILIIQIQQNAAAFLAGPKGAIAYTLYHRPAFWSLPFVEWMVFLSLLSMVGFFSYVLMRRSQLQVTAIRR